MKQNIKSTELSRISVFLLIALILTALHGAVLWYLFQNQYRRNLELMMVAQENMIHFERQKMSSELGRVIQDLLILEEYTSEHLSHDRRLDDHEFNPFVQLIGGFSNRYSMIRLISPSGNEMYRLNYSDEGVSSPALDVELQNKSKRYYFEELKERGESVYMSRMDLNVEHGEIEVPYRPVIRFGKRIIDENGDLMAYLILNYRGTNLLDTLGDYEILPKENFDTYLLNNEGYWLKGPDQKKTFGFMFPGKQDNTLAEIAPDIWMRLQTEEKGSFILDGNMYIHRTVHLEDLIDPEWGEYIGGNNERERSYYLVYTTPEKILQRMSGEIQRSLILPFVITEFFILLLSYLIAGGVYKLRKYQRKLLHYSNIDELTGCLNRRAGQKILDQALHLGRRRNSVLTIAYLDLNGLKYVNDHLGHREGDRYILTMVDLVKEQLRSSDFFIRLGGDEFLLILPDCGEKQAWKIRYRILSKEHKLNQAGIYSYPLGMSWGILEIRADHSISSVQALAEADKLMYREKSSYPKADPLSRKEIGEERESMS